MYRAPVVSSNVASVGYDEDSSTLEVEFNNGAVYQYFDVSKSVYEGLIGADSVGSYLASHVKGNYRYSKV